MKITRKFTTAGQDVYSTVKWVNRSSKITNPDGSVVFKMDDASVPESWSQLATDIMVSKYFRKAGVPQTDPATGLPVTDASGKVTLEISNTTPLPAKVYANEGIGQLLFFRADMVCSVSYADKSGKYQDQSGLTLPKVD